MNKLLGANWRTSLAGIGAGLMLILHNIADLPYTFGQVADLFGPEWKKRVVIAAGIATGLLLIFGGVNAKDKRVTGGVKPNDVEPPSPAGRSAFLFLFGIMAAAFLLPLALVSCATDTGDPAKDKRGRISNAVLEETFNSVLSFGLAEGRQYLTGQNGQDAAGAAFTAASNGILSSAGLRHIIQASAGPAVAAKAAAVFAEASPRTPEEAAAVSNTIGAALQNASNQLAK